MTTLVMKFGGKSLKTPKHVDRVVEIIISKIKAYCNLTVITSAMGNTTDNLIRLAYQVSPSPGLRELDMLISVGERISMSLLAMALQKKGIQAISLTGSQSGIHTCDNHSNARIIHVDPKRIKQYQKKIQVVIVAGFQGVSLKKEITTLGRGGSDTSAVAMALALGAKKVEFYKDVEGVYRKDPKKGKTTQIYSTLNYKEALCLAKNEHFVLHPRAISLASQNRMPLHVLSFKRTKSSVSGTLIFEENKAICNDLTYESHSNT